MQTILTLPTINLPSVNETDAQRVAGAYVVDAIDPAFAVVSGIRHYHKPLGREVWQFIIRCAYGPLDAIYVDVQTGAVIPRTAAEIRRIQEKAALFAARQQGVLPLNEQGYVLAEYARRQASGYLATQLGLFYEGADPVFVPSDPPLWQITIVFQMYNVGPYILGLLDVNAKTGTPKSLTNTQIEYIQERARAIVRHQTPAPTTS